jgi:methionine sulfoxide reductase heme-binding subunit
MIIWNLIRAAGIGAFVMLWASVTWGLISTTSVFGKRVSKATSVALHQVFGTLGVLLLAAHLILLVTDSFMPFAPLDLVIPMRASYRPVGVTLGIASMFLMVFGVLATSWGRKVIGTKWWRRTHSLAVPAYVLAMGHGLMTGTDTQRPVMFWVYVATAGIQLFLLLMRAFTFGNRPQRAPAPADAPRRIPAPVLVAAEAEPPGATRTVPASAISDGAIR